MLAELGIVVTALGLLCAVFGMAASAYGASKGQERWVSSARNAALLTWPLLTIACITLIAAQITGEFNIQYVYSVTDVNEPLFFKITALWGGQAGSLLFWAWMLSTFTAAAVLLNWRSEPRLMPWVLTFTMAVLSFFMILVVFYENPFARFWNVPGANGVVVAVLMPLNATLYQPGDGQGLNPLLRHPGMSIHPPMLYGGYVGLVIPWAFAMAALASGQLNNNWLRVTRRWTLVAWLFLSLGLMLGARWAYDVLGWGGYWSWDPVENSALMPWLAATAFLHSVMIQEKRGMLKAWNLFLIIISFLLVILGTFSTRTGFVASVHSFAQSPLGGVMFAFVSVMMLGCLGLWAWRFRNGDLASDHQLSALISRESMFVLNNWIIMSITLAVFWGTYAPVFSQALTGNAITLGAGYFQLVLVPLFGVLYVLMGIAPLVAWKKSTISALGRSVRIPLALTALTIVVLFLTGVRDLGGYVGYGLLAFAGYAMLSEFYRGVRGRMKHGENPLTALFRLFQRDRRRYGGYFIHLGIVVIGIGLFASSAYQQQTEQTINPGDKIALGDMSLVYEDLFQATADDGRQMTIANVAVYQGNDYVGDIRPRRDVFQNSLTPVTIAGQYSTLDSDFYVILSDWSGYRATFKVFLNPLINLIWWGGIVLIVGTLIAAWPSRKMAAVKRPVEARTLDQLELMAD